MKLKLSDLPTESNVLSTGKTKQKQKTVNNKK